MVRLESKHVIKAVCAFHGVTIEDLSGPVRTAGLQWPRHEMSHMLRLFTDLSLVSIGQLLGGRDSTTIQNALRRVAQRREADPEYAQDLERLRSFVEAYDMDPRGASAIGRARRLMSAVETSHNPDADELGMTLLIVASILASAELSDAEARLAALSTIGRGAPHA